MTDTGIKILSIIVPLFKGGLDWRSNNDFERRIQEEQRAHISLEYYFNVNDYPNM